MTASNDCPYGVGKFPKVEELDTRVKALEKTLDTVKTTSIATLVGVIVTLIGIIAQGMI